MEKAFIDGIHSELAGKRVLLLGYGKEGRSSLSFIRTYMPELETGIADMREPDSVPDGVRCHFGSSYLSAAEDYDVILKSPGIALKDSLPPKLLARIRSQTELFLSCCPVPVIGVTGTKGKSTTSALIHHILTDNGHKSVLLGNIGIPPLSGAEEIEPDSVVVFELSSHQLEYCRVSPEIAVLTNIYPEHLDHYVSYEAYREAKYNIFRYQKPDGFFVYPIDCEEFDAQTLASESQAARLTIRPEPGRDDTLWACTGDGDKLTLSLGDRITELTVSCPLAGMHNRRNVAMAVSVCALYGVKPEQAALSCAGFRPLPHRLECIGTNGGVTYYNDSIATIPAATLNAIEALPRVDTLIVGGMDRGVPYEAFARMLSVSKLSVIIFLPGTGHLLYRLMNDEPKQLLVCAGSLPEAVTEAKRLTPSGGVCLFSPAAASYGYYKNFAERGEHFRALALN